MDHIVTHTDLILYTCTHWELLIENRKGLIDHINVHNWGGKILKWLLLF